MKKVIFFILNLSIFILIIIEFIFSFVNDYSELLGTISFKIIINCNIFPTFENVYIYIRI